MQTILNEKELNSFLRTATFGQRQDSLQEQVSDLIPVFETLGLKSVAEKLRSSFTYSPTELQEDYLNKINEVRVKFDLSERAGIISQNIAARFGCNDVAEFAKYYF